MVPCANKFDMHFGWPFVISYVATWPCHLHENITVRGVGFGAASQATFGALLEQCVIMYSF
jgi:hypothetical protein